MALSQQSICLTWTRRWHTVCLSLLCGATLLPGCAVPREPVWLPDSSGFIYTTVKGSVVHYDVEKAKRRTVVKATDKATTSIPAISPDGKILALARVSSVGTGSIQLRLHELASGNLLQTDTLELTAVEPDYRPFPESTSGAIWSPCGKYVLFWYVNHKLDVSGGYYAVRTRVIKIFESVTPAMTLWAVRLSPMSDDGRGFLASPSDDSQEMLFVEFDGRHHPLKETEQSKQFFKQQVPTDEILLQFTPFPRGHWTQGVAQIAIGGGWLVIDTVRHSIDYQRDEQLTKQREAALRDKVAYVAPIGSGKFVVRCRASDEDRTAQVELFEKDTAKATPLGTIDITNAVFGGLTQPVIASPDGRRVVVSCQTKMGSTQWSVIDHAGKILATLVDPAFED